MSDYRRSVAEIAENEIARWRAQRAQSGGGASAKRPQPAVIAMSHAPWDGGDAIARGVGDALGIPTYDQEIVQHIASEAHVHRAAVETLEDYVLSRVEQHVQTLLTGPHFDRSDYLRFLARTVAVLWEAGPCVITGHGCPFLLPRSHTLAVRTVADLPDRLARLAQSEGLEAEEARHRLHEQDKEHTRYYERYFGADIRDSTQFDLVLNTSRLGREGCTAMVIAACEQRFAGGIRQAPAASASGLFAPPPKRR